LLFKFYPINRTLFYN